MTTVPPPVAGDLVADRYRLLARVDRDLRSERYRARDVRLQRDVLVEVGLQGGPSGVRDLSGAEDTGMHSVLDGGEVAGRTFVVRELSGSAYDETAPIHLGESTAVMALPDWSELPPLPATPAPVPPPRRRRAPSGAVWLVGLAAAALLAVVLATWGGTGNLDPADATTTTTTAKVEAASKGKRTTAQTTPTTAVPTTTVAPPTTDTTLGFPFDDGGPLPPGQAKKHDGEG